MQIMLLLIYALIVTTLYLYFTGLVRLLYTRQQKAEARMNRYLSAQGQKDAKDARRITRSELLKRLGGLLIRKNRKKGLELMLTRSGIPLRSEEFALCSFCCVIIPPVLAYLLTENIFSAAVFFIAGYAAPRMFVKASIKKRLNRFNRQLPDAVNIMIYSLKSGLSLIQAFESVATEMAGPVGDEFRRMVTEIKLLSRPKEEALENMNARVGSDDLDLVVTAIIIQAQIGGNLAEILENIAETVRDRIKINGEIRALTAQGRMSGIIVASIPLLVGAAILVLNPGYLSPLAEYPLGWILIGYSVLSEMVGFVVIKRIISIEF
jgi:tight adherence protein B